MNTERPIKKERKRLKMVDLIAENTRPKGRKHFDEMFEANCLGRRTAVLVFQELKITSEHFWREVIMSIGALALYSITLYSRRKLGRWIHFNQFAFCDCLQESGHFLNPRELLEQCQTNAA